MTARLPIFRLCTVVFAAAILFLSLQPSTGQASIPHADKVQHVLAYGVLAVLTGLGWPRLRRVWLIVLPALFGVGVEVLQGAMAMGRTPSVLDAVANTLGAAIGSALIGRWRSR